ncbi:hypothetical protein [Modestobacter sp. SYSU DS0290]
MIAVLAMALVFVSGCGDAAPEDAVPEQVAASTTPETTDDAVDEDTSLQDAIDAAGISSDLVSQLGRVAGDTGYGLRRGTPLTGDEARGFAVVQIGTCRELASGFRSLDELVASDMAGGAGEADARTMAAFLRDSFCPAVRPLDPAPGSPAPTRATHVSDGTRGLLSSVDHLDGALAPGSLAECAAATGEPFGDPRAYALPGGQLLCGDYLPGGPWDDHFINLDVVFPQPVPVDEALLAVAAILPEDLGAPSMRDGVNPPYAPAPGGCLSVVWSSPTVERVVARINPDWGTEGEANAVLYSDRPTSDGSSAPFDGTVRVAAVGFGGHNDTSGSVIC